MSGEISIPIQLCPTSSKHSPLSPLPHPISKMLQGGVELVAAPGRLSKAMARLVKRDCISIIREPWVYFLASISL